jgi:hypothetical protein
VNPQNKSDAKMIAAMAVALHLAGSRLSSIFGCRLERLSKRHYFSLHYHRRFPYFHHPVAHMVELADTLL